jgi:hypothetical protein
VALDYPTIDFLVRHLLSDVLKLDGQEPLPASKGEPALAPDKDLDTLSDAELARLVAEDLAKDS